MHKICTFLNKLLLILAFLCNFVANFSYLVKKKNEEICNIWYS